MTVPYSVTIPAASKITMGSLLAHARHLEAEGDKEGAAALSESAKRLQEKTAQELRDEVIAADIFYEIHPGKPYQTRDDRSAWRAAARAARQAVLREQGLDFSGGSFSRHITR